MPRFTLAFLFAFLVPVLAGCGDSQQPPPPPAQPAPPAAPPSPGAAPEAKAEPKADPKVDSKVDPNRELAARVKQALESDAKIQAAGIDITAADGAVTLWGTTASDAERSRAAQAAAKIDGVKSVTNKLAVVRGS